LSDTERPFEATPRRILKAQREGNIARSSELPANLSFAAAATSIVALVSEIARIFSGAIDEAVSGRVPVSALLLVALALVVVAAAAAAGTLTSCLQNGGFRVVAVTPKLERLNPFSGLGRILSRETFSHSVRASLAFTCASAAMAPFILGSGSALLQEAAPLGVAAAAWNAAQRLAFAACAVGCAFAIAEYVAARRAWLSKLRMSVDDRKRESKEEEGDAAARGRRRALHRALLRGGIRRIKDAAFVVVNPSHVAVALEYEPPRVAVPRVLVRAADAAAIKVRAIAVSRRIPIVENVWLARALYRDCRPGEPIPQEHYVAVAEVVATLLRTSGLHAG
jgi:flagellar biosynthesis protein FlhB